MERKTPETYDEALAASEREARATLAAALAVTVYFWGAIALFHGNAALFLGFPLWFLVSVVGGYVLSVVVVWWLVKRVFVDFSLEMKPEEDRP